MKLLTFLLSAVAFLALCVSVDSAEPSMLEALDVSFQVPQDSGAVLAAVSFAPSRATTGLERDHTECTTPAAPSVFAAIGSAGHESMENVYRCACRLSAVRANTSAVLEPG